MLRIFPISIGAKGPFDPLRGKAKYLYFLNYIINIFNNKALYHRDQTAYTLKGMLWTVGTWA